MPKMNRKFTAFFQSELNLSSTFTVILLGPIPVVHRIGWLAAYEKNRGMMFQIPAGRFDHATH